MRCAAWSLVLLGCFSKPPAPSASDGSIGSDGARADADPAGPSCAGVPFAPSSDIHSELGSTFVSDATLSANELELFFTTDPGAFVYDIARATRASVSDVFIRDPDPLPFNSDDYADADASLTADGLMLVFVSQRAGGSGLWHVTRSATGGWSTAAPVPGLVSVGSTSADVSPDGLAIYFADDSDPTQLRRAVRPDRASLFIVEPLVLGIDRLFPSVGSAGRELFFNDVNDSQVGYATRTHTSEPFDPPTQLFPGYYDADISADNETIVATQGSSFVIAHRNCP